MAQYTFDSVRWCKVRARAARASRQFDEENNHLRIASEIEDLRAKERNLETVVKAFHAAIARETRLREALGVLYGKLLMSERDGEVVITAEDGELARAALRKEREDGLEQDTAFQV